MRGLAFWLTAGVAPWLITYAVGVLVIWSPFVLAATWFLSLCVIGGLGLWLFNPQR